MMNLQKGYNPQHLRLDVRTLFSWTIYWSLKGHKGFAEQFEQSDNYSNMIQYCLQLSCNV